MTRLDLQARYASIDEATPDERSSSVSGLLDAIRRLAPMLNEQRAAFDELRRLPDDVFDALADAGLFRLWLPKAVGGPELSPFEFMRVTETISAVDGSVGWLVGNGAGMSRVGGYVAKAVAREWFSDPRAFVAAATGAVCTATPVKGGYRVTGRWPFGSGAHHASLFMALAAEAADAPPLCCYIPRRDVTILDNWHVSGLRAGQPTAFRCHELATRSRVYSNRSWARGSDAPGCASFPGRCHDGIDCSHGYWR